jgi:hypothetical protein
MAEDCPVIGSVRQQRAGLHRFPRVDAHRQSPCECELAEEASSLEEHTLGIHGDSLRVPFDHSVERFRQIASTTRLRELDSEASVCTAAWLSSMYRRVI